MSLSVGIVGLSNVGKSTLFNALASRRLAETAPRPFTTIEPHEAVVPVPDNNLDRLYEMIVGHSSTPEESSSNTPGESVMPEKIPATVKFIDIAGLVKGAHKGEGLGNQFLAKIREVDALVHVVRAFYDPQVVHQYDSFETGSLEQIYEDIEIVNLELALGGIENIPSLLVLNIGEDEISSPDTKEKIISVTEKFKTDTIAISAKIEEELIDFDDKERKEFLKQSGIEDTGLNRLINAAYRMLDLIIFYTIKGGKEIHAWSIARGASALEAAGVVHTDFERNFIKAEVINVEKLIKAGGWKKAKDNGLVKLEGKDYAIADGDVIEIVAGK